MTTHIPGTNGEQAAANLLADVQLRLELLMNEKGVSRAALADILGVTRSRITRLLDAESNMTIATLGRVFEALGEVPEFTSPAIRDALDRLKAISFEDEARDASEINSATDTGSENSYTLTWLETMGITYKNLGSNRAPRVEFVQCPSAVNAHEDDMMEMVA